MSLVQKPEGFRVTLRVQVPNNHILCKILTYNTTVPMTKIYSPKDKPTKLLSQTHVPIFFGDGVQDWEGFKGLLIWCASLGFKEGQALYRVDGLRN